MRRVQANSGIVRGNSEGGRVEVYTRKDMDNNMSMVSHKRRSCRQTNTSPPLLCLSLPSLELLCRTWHKLHNMKTIQALKVIVYYY